MQKKKKKNKLFIFLIICFVLVPFLLTKGCNYMESLNQAKNSVSETITSISGQIESSRVHAQAHSIRKANWTGTAVPNTGVVDKIYINDKLSFQEMFNILLTIDYEPVEESTYLGIYVVLYCGEKDAQIIITKFSETDTDRGFEFEVSVNREKAWTSVNNEGYTTYGSNLLMMQQAYGYISIEDEALNTYYLNKEYDVGLQNNKLKALISITPFQDISDSELSIGNLFTQIGNAIIIFGGAVVNVFISMEPIFWNEGPTLIFILLIAAVSFGLVFWGIELLISLIGVFKTKRKKKK